MKKIVFIAAAILMAVSCHVEKQDELADTQQLSSDWNDTFYAYAEGNTPETKTYMDGNLQVRWKAGDRISLFNRFTFNFQYQFNGADGDIEGSFVRVPSNLCITGIDIDHIYAVYPYRADTKINRAGTTITMTLPGEQSYRENSFGPGANATVAVTDDESLEFKNVGGYLVVRLYGDDVPVSRVTIQGNNHEKISGKARIAVGLDTNPTVTMDETASETLSNVCATPVMLGNSSVNYTDFWFVLPPTTFTNGITITVTDGSGTTYTHPIFSSITIARNTVEWMSPIQVGPHDDVYVDFADANFKAYCVEHFDTDGDGEISVAEAMGVTTIDVNTDKITSLEGIMSFENLEYLTAQGSAGVWFGNGGLFGWGNYYLFEPYPTNPAHGTVLATGKLSGVNLSHHNHLKNVTIRANNPMTVINLSDCPLLQSVTVQFCGISQINLSNDTALTELDCVKNQLTTLNVSNNTALTSLFCDLNQLSALDVSNNTILTNLGCAGNQITSLDVSNNTALTSLICSLNQLTALDVSSNTALTHLLCYNNQLTSLDVSNNAALAHLSCLNNPLTTLDVSNNSALRRLWCSNNLLTNLDVSNNTALRNLWCDNNQLTSLDVSNNAALLELRCGYNQLTTLDVSYNTALTQLWCYGNPNLTALWLQTGQTIPDLQYDPDVTTIYYRRLLERGIGRGTTSKKIR